MDFLNTALLNSLVARDSSGNPVATFDGSGRLTSGNLAFTMAQTVPESEVTAILTVLALSGWVASSRSRRSRA